MILSTILALAAALIAALAILRGGKPERAMGVGVLAVIIVSPFLRFYPVGLGEYPGFVCDVLLLVLSIGLALQSNRWWLLFFTAFVAVDGATRIAASAGSERAAMMREPDGLLWMTLAVIALALGVFEGRRHDRLARS